MGIHSAVSAQGQMFQAFPLGGPIKRFEANAATWTEVPLAQACDLFKLRVAGGSKTVLLTHNGMFNGLEDGDAIETEHLVGSDIFDPGVHVYSSDRQSGFKFFLGVDGTDRSTGADTVKCILTEAKES